jgi:hypothetical protein
MKLREGKSYNFVNLRTITLPGGDVNIMLAAPDGKKYLLSLERYTSYDLPLKPLIRCKVDKINCSGKVFLEPEHPYYREGKSYLFSVVTGTPASDEMTDEKLITIADKRGELFNIPAFLLKNHPGVKKIKLRIERITKGRLFFTAQREKDDLENLEEGNTYRFMVDRIITGPDYETYYVVVDIYGREHLLNHRYYEHYGLSPGHDFTGRVIRYGTGRAKSIEPQNPWYSPGDIINVTVSSSVADESGERYITEVIDSNGFIHNLVLNDMPSLPLIRCRIVRMKKGRPVLEIVPD